MKLIDCYITRELLVNVFSRTNASSSISRTRETPRAHREVLVWLPNLLFIGAGIAIFRRRARH